MKEIRETIRQTVFVMSFFLLVPLLYLLDSSIYGSGWTFIEYMSNGLDLFVLITAGYMAYNIFRSEEDQNAEEYLFSLPIDRTKLFCCKMIPRYISVLILLAAAKILNNACHSSGSVIESLFLNWHAGIVYVIFLMAFILLSGLILNLVGRRSWSTRIVMFFICALVWQSVTFTIVLNGIISNLFGWPAAFEFSLMIGSAGRALIDFGVFFLLLVYILKPLALLWDLRPVDIRESWFQRRMILPAIVFVLLLVNSLMTPNWQLFAFMN